MVNYVFGANLSGWHSRLGRRRNTVNTQDDEQLQDDLPELDENGYAGPSKSSLKRESHALQKLGETLAKMSPAALKALPLPDNLRDAIEHMQSIKSRGASRRQRQYLGKVMRNVDAEPIREAIEALEQKQHRALGHFHSIERWRDRFLEEGEAAATDFIDKYPATDRQHLRSLVRAASNAGNEEKRTRAARSLFKYLREIMADEPAQANDDN
jgi:ribosome-associated protein